MFTRKNLVSSLLAIGLALGISAGAVAAESHSHDGHDAGSMKLTLDAGKKWQGNDELRKAMGEIRVAMSSRLGEIHENKLPTEAYKALATSVQGQVDYMIEHCDFPEAEDEQVHIILNQIAEGIDEMEEGSQPRNGAVKIVQAHNAYGKYFKHQGWQPLGK